MTKDNSNTRTPIIRFPGFTGEWREKKLNEVFSRVTRKNAENNQNVLTISAQYGLISQLEFFKKSVASSDVTGYYLLHKGEFAYNKSSSQGRPVGAIKPLRLYDKGVVSTLYICFKCNNSEEIDFWEQYFDAGILDSEILSIAQEGARNHGLLNISTGDFFGLNVILPTPPEMKKIAECLSSFDDVITAAENELDSLKAHKKGLMQQLFPQPSATTPALRFPGFSGNWEKKKFKDITVPAGKKNRQNIPYERYSISNEDGFYPQSSQFEDGGGYLKDIDCRQYIIVPPKSFAYNPARINVGSIGYQDLGKDVIVSSLYEVFQTKDGIDDTFLWQWFHTDIFRRMVINVQEGGVRQYFFYEKLRECSINLPTLSEQKIIAACLEAEDQMIAAQEQKVESLKIHKKGLMQQLFPQPVK